MSSMCRVGVTEDGCSWEGGEGLGISTEYGDKGLSVTTLEAWRQTPPGSRSSGSLVGTQGSLRSLRDEGPTGVEFWDCV